MPTTHILIYDLSPALLTSVPTTKTTSVPHVPVSALAVLFRTQLFLSPIGALLSQRQPVGTDGLDCRIPLILYNSVFFHTLAMFAVCVLFYADFLLIL
jgi:hypothetical protein